MFVPNFADICVAIRSRRGIVISDLDSLDLLAIKFLLIVDAWGTTAYAAAKQPKTLASPKIWIPMTMTDCSLVSIDLGIFTRLLLRLFPFLPLLFDHFFLIFVHVLDKVLWVVATHFQRNSNMKH